MRILLLLIYLGGTFSPLLDISKWNYFRRWGGGGCTCTQYTPPCVRACFYWPVDFSKFFVSICVESCTVCHFVLTPFRHAPGFMRSMRKNREIKKKKKRKEKPREIKYGLSSLSPAVFTVSLPFQDWLK